MSEPSSPSEQKSPLQEITQPFIDLIHAPRALWGINLGYFIEGFVYFGVLGYLAMYFNQYVSLDDVWAGRMVGVLSAGITISMFFFGAVSDKWGVRLAILLAFILMFVGRVLLSLGPYMGLGSGWGSPTHLLAMTGILVIVLGYGMYQPAAYAGVRQFTTPKTAGMAFAMLYALMNLGGFLPTFMPPVRRAIGISGAYWVYTSFTVAALVTTYLILTRRVVDEAIAEAKRDSGAPKEVLDNTGRVAADIYCRKCGYNQRTLLATGYCPECNTPVRESLPARKCASCEQVETNYQANNCGRCGKPLPALTKGQAPPAEPAATQVVANAPLREALRLPAHLWGVLLIVIVLTAAQAFGLWSRLAGGDWPLLSRAWLGILVVELVAPAIIALLPGDIRIPIVNWLAMHPLANAKFFFFIFALIPVQTLFAHNWLTLPMYVERAYRGTWLGTNFEVATNFNPILIFILVPIVAAITQKAKVYNMMILGTLVMAAPTFLLAIGPHPAILGAFLILMTVGEAMWQPRFLQYAAEIAPEGQTGQYMGVAQFPWFLTKLIVPIYSGWFLAHYCPATGPTATRTMWFIYGCIAMCSCVLLVAAKGWVGKDFKTKAGE